MILAWSGYTKEMRFFLIVLLSLLAGCSGGAVVFAPTPPPADTSPLRYEHPSGAFAVMVPRQWAVFSQNATTLATASFSAPDSSAAQVTFAVLRLGQALNSSDFGNLIDEYQHTLRPDATRYKEENRQAMGDGSWRIDGLRQTAGGSTEQVNTFFERQDAFVGVIDVVVPADNLQRQAALQDIINSFEILPDSSLEAANSSVLVSLAASSIDFLNIATWSTPQGVFYITGEVANYSAQPLVDLPVQAVLHTESGQAVAEAVDTPMGYGVLPGGFAPFSLRFGQGEPVPGGTYELILGGPDWQAQPDAVIYGPGDLDWIDDSRFDENGDLVITGTVTNVGAHVVRSPRASATVFGTDGRVIGARFVDLASGPLDPNESLDFSITLSELGGSPAQYIVSVQALP